MRLRPPGPRPLSRTDTNTQRAARRGGPGRERLRHPWVPGHTLSRAPTDYRIECPGAARRVHTGPRKHPAGMARVGTETALLLSGLADLPGRCEGGGRRDPAAVARPETVLPHGSAQVIDRRRQLAVSQRPRAAGSDDRRRRQGCGRSSTGDVGRLRLTAGPDGCLALPAARLPRCARPRAVGRGCGRPSSVSVAGRPDQGGWAQLRSVPISAMKPVGLLSKPWISWAKCQAPEVSLVNSAIVAAVASATVAKSSDSSCR